MLYTMKFLRFQSISTQHADLIAIKFWFEKFTTSFCESFYSTSYNFEIIQVEIDNFIVYLENNKKIDSNLIRLRNTNLNIDMSLKRFFIRIFILCFIFSYATATHPKFWVCTH